MTSKSKNTMLLPSDKIIAERFADIQVLRYEVTGFESLTLKQKKLAYYLTQAGLSGRDIYWDQKYKHNLKIRKLLEHILNTYSGSRVGEQWQLFESYCKQVFFANGIHHHYSNEKIIPAFKNEYFKELLPKSDQQFYQDVLKTDWMGVMSNIVPLMFAQSIDFKTVDLAADVDNVKASCNNFYENVSKAEVEKFYSDLAAKFPKENLPSLGLNSKLIKTEKGIFEKTYKVDGMYGKALKEMVYWLKLAVTVAENPIQAQTLNKLITYFETGDLAAFDTYNISWVKDTTSRIDLVLGFIEVYHDAIGKKGSYEAVISMKDLEASKTIATIAANAQWFEDNSPIATAHKKSKVTGISAKVITVINEGGDAAPATPIGINLPNAEWIREGHGSKSVSLGNIVASNNFAKAKSPMIDEFGSNGQVTALIKKHGALAGMLHTDMHEVIGHASGQLNPGVATTDVTLVNYASTLEEARADLVALYYIMDQKLVDIGVCPTTDVGKAQYDSYILNGLMTQLYRIKPGNNIEEAHMRNRQLICKWVLEKGETENVIEKIVRNNKTYFVISDYQKLRNLFGQLLAEVQRIKSEGDFNAGKNLVEKYGVVVDQELLKEVHQRCEKLNMAPYTGFIQPTLVPTMNAAGDITDVTINYNNSFISQMLMYGKKYAFLDIEN
ncbi:MAG: dihydrofolate reductase [Bacteroidia bacterium]|nr:dihydrofolate reductase [Bacteroidia bacterium]